jgi:hypothetical protein
MKTWGLQKVVDFANTHPWAQLVLELLLQAVKETLFLTVTAEEALFKGYEDPLVKSICNKHLLQVLCEKLPKRIGFFLGVCFAITKVTFPVQ